MNDPAVCPVSWSWHLEGSHPWLFLLFTCPTCGHFQSPLLEPLPHFTITYTLISLWCSAHLHLRILPPGLSAPGLPAPGHFLTRVAHQVCHKRGYRWASHLVWPGKAHCTHPSVLYKYPLSVCFSKWEQSEALGYTMNTVPKLPTDQIQASVQLRPKRM